MRHVSHLRQLDRNARSKLSRFERRARLLRFGRGDSGQVLDEHQLETELSYLTINIQSYWENWCRAFYISTVLGTVSSSGAAISSGLGINTERDALTIAIKGSVTPSKLPPPAWGSNQEPRWFDPDILSRALTVAVVNIAGSSNIFLNAASDVLSKLRMFRNYYAHRSEPLRHHALSIGPSYLIGNARNPSQILLFVEPMHTVSVLERWILEIDRLAGALCA